ncbi:M15 family metallopeptidase [candidate division WWE3 bacterium]|nr:M15 family metallopeptidase [candidate division WWE3 bacterium]
MNQLLAYLTALIINVVAWNQLQTVQDQQLAILDVTQPGFVLGTHTSWDSEMLKYVDKQNSIGTDSPTDLVALSDIGYPYQFIRSYVLSDLTRLMNDARAAKLDMRIVSAFRSYDTQQSLFNSYAKRYGVTQANRFSALPGFSEHQLGTAIDFGNGHSTDLSDSFFYQPEGAWLFRNAYKYGFVMSYPKDKQTYTGYIFEPWHYRYVGVDNATALYNAGLTINEYSDREAQRLSQWLESARLVVGLDESLPVSRPILP